MSSENEFHRIGQPWADPYRGSRYHFNPLREVWWHAALTKDKVRAKSGHEDLIDELLAFQPEGGSFRITETAAVLAKTPAGENEWQPFYVADYLTPLEFEHVDVLGNGVEPLDLWPAFYDGARYSVKRGTLWFKNVAEDVWQRTKEPLPQDLQERFDKVKPTGGSLRITENGKVIVLIEPQPMAAHIEGQYKALSTVQKNLIEIKFSTTHRIPIFLGEHHDGFELHKAELLTDPLDPDREAVMISFLKQYGDGVRAQPSVFDPDDDLESLLATDDMDPGDELEADS